jgi:hypothetical protein
MACKEYERFEREKDIADDNSINHRISAEDRNKAINESIELRNMMEAHKRDCPDCKNTF